MSADVVIEILDAEDVLVARRAARELARELGFSLADVTMIATAITEIAHNSTIYAGCGVISVGIAHRQGRPALVVRVDDDGPGIPDVDRALEPGYSTQRRLGLGLPCAGRLMDGLAVDSAPGCGTTVDMWKWMPDEVSE